MCHYDMGGCLCQIISTSLTGIHSPELSFRNKINCNRDIKKKLTISLWIANISCHKCHPGGRIIQQVSGGNSFVKKVNYKGINSKQFSKLHFNNS